MASATGYTLSVQPLVAAGQTTSIAATLTGGTDLDASLSIQLSNADSTFPGQITIGTGSTSGSASFVFNGGDGSQIVRATHTGGNSGMADAVASFIGVSPTNPPVTGFDFAIAGPSIGYVSTWIEQPTNSAGPDGDGLVITAYPLGGWMAPGPIQVRFADDANGIFLPSKLDLVRTRDLQFGGACSYYLPTVSGTRTITATAYGAPAGFSTPSPKTVAVSISGPPSGDFSLPFPGTLPGSPPACTLPPITPTYPAATGFSFAIVSPPPGYQAQSTIGVGGCRTGPINVAQYVYVRLYGSGNNAAQACTLEAPLVVTLSDDGGGLFPSGPVTIAGGDPAHQFAVVPYVPTTAGPRTLSASFTGGNPGFTTPEMGIFGTFFATSN